jgi:hypothetical protein
MTLAANPASTRRFLGDGRGARWSAFMRANISGFASNISLGFMRRADSCPSPGFRFELEARHVTLSARQLAAAGASPGSGAALARYLAVHGGDSTDRRAEPTWASFFLCVSATAASTASTALTARASAPPSGVLARTIPPVFSAQLTQVTSGSPVGCCLS